MTQSLNGAGWFFSASHRDPIRKELHGHSYEVMVYWRLEENRDAYALQEMVKEVCRVRYDHKTLPDHITRAEDIARELGRLLDGVVRVDIARPAERFKVEVWL